MIYRYMCLTPKCQDMFAQPPRVGDWRPGTSCFPVEKIAPESVHFTPTAPAQSEHFILFGQHAADKALQRVSPEVGQV